MLNVEQAIKNFDINTSSRSAAVAGVRLFLESKPEEKQVQATHDFMYEVFGMRVDFTDRTVARLTAQYVIDAVGQNRYDIGNAPQVIADAQAKATALYTNPANAWMFATGESSSSFTVDSDVPKAPKKNKGTASKDLYDVHVKNAVAPLTNIEFVHLLVKELGMTTSGARTYAYNCYKDGKEKK